MDGFSVQDFTKLCPHLELGSSTKLIQSGQQNSVSYSYKPEPPISLPTGEGDWVLVQTPSAHEHILLCYPSIFKANNEEPPSH